MSSRELPTSGYGGHKPGSVTTEMPVSVDLWSSRSRGLEHAQEGERCTRAAAKFLTFHWKIPLLGRGKYLRQEFRHSGRRVVIFPLCTPHSDSKAGGQHGKI